MQRIKSLLIWCTLAVLVLAWLPLLAVVRLFERDKSRYRTGYLFRRLGAAMSKVNPFWKVTIQGAEDIDDREPYVMVSNHQSNADIPVISNLPWEMKWIAKRELFQIPIVGWMMYLAGDISVDRGTSKAKISTFRKSIFYLRNRVSVIFFPEGTRSRDGRVNRFSNGAFELAIREQIPVLPMVIDGTEGCLPKNSWVFKSNVHAQLKVLEPIPTTGLTSEDVEDLANVTREKIIQELMDIRQCTRSEADGMSPQKY